MTSRGAHFRGAVLLLCLTLGCGGSDGSPSETPVIVLSEIALALTEGTPETLTVVLQNAPSADLTVALASGGRATVLPTSLSFTPANFDTPRSVIITPVQDADLADGTDSVTATAPGLLTVILPVAIDDDDIQGIILDTTDLVIDEGDTASFTVRLAYQPAASVTVDFGPLDTNVTVSQSAALFTTGSWDTPVRVTITTHHDTDLGDETTFVAAGIAGGPTELVNVTVDDDDTQGLIVDTDSLVIVEGDTASFTVRLAYQPASSVTVDFGPLDTNVTVSQSAALFTTGSWDTPVRVTITTHHDTDTGDEDTFVAMGIVSGPNAIVYVTVEDDDDQAIETSASAIVVSEGGTNTVGVRLAFQPTGDFTVNAASSDGLTATVASSATLTFTTGNWDAYQNVTMAGTQDNNVAAGTASLALTGIGVTTRNVTVNVNDDDTQAIVSSVDTIFVTEGDTAEVMITLAFQPPSSTTVTVTLDALIASTFSPTLNFTTGNWNTGFTIQILGAEDANTTDEETLLELTAPGGLAREVLVRVTDND